MACEMCLAILAPNDLVRVQVDVVLETHLSGPPFVEGGATNGVLMPLTYAESKGWKSPGARV